MQPHWVFIFSRGAPGSPPCFPCLHPLRSASCLEGQRGTAPPQPCPAENPPGAPRGPGVSSRKTGCFLAGPQAAFPHPARRRGCRAPWSEHIKVFPHPSRRRHAAPPRTACLQREPLAVPLGPPGRQRLLTAPSSEPPGWTSHTAFITLGSKDLYQPFPPASREHPEGSKHHPDTRQYLEEQPMLSGWR